MIANQTETHTKWLKQLKLTGQGNTSGVNAVAGY